jgi:hypothetical protein
VKAPTESINLLSKEKKKIRKKENLRFEKNIGMIRKKEKKVVYLVKVFDISTKSTRICFTWRAIERVAASSPSSNTLS